jgi:hypothetical protein
MKFSLRGLVLAFGVATVLAGLMGRAVVLDPEEERLRTAIRAVGERGVWDDRDTDQVQLILADGSLSAEATPAVLAAKRIRAVVFHNGGFPPGAVEHAQAKPFHLFSLVNGVAVY